MPKAYDTWTVHPHGKLTALADGVHVVDGSLPGMPLPRRMTAIRRADGGLILHNPIAVDDATRAQVEALGPVRDLVVPSGHHRLDSKSFVQRYPDARVVAPRGAKRRVEEVVPVGATYDEVADDGRVAFAHLDGLREAEGVLVVRGGDGVTVVVNDVLFNLPHFGGLFGLVYGRLMGNAGAPRVTTVARLFVVKDKRALAAHFERLAALDPKRLVMSHGDVIVDDVAVVLRRLAASL